MVREIIRMDEQGKPMKAIYQVYKDHPIPDMVGDIDYDKVPSNRFEFSYFGLLRARLLALWDAEYISAKELGIMLQAVADSNLTANPFQDEAVAEANDETVIEMITNLTDVNKALASSAIKWCTTFDEVEPYFDEMMCQLFGSHLLGAVIKLRDEPVSMFSEEQLNAYGELAMFFIDSIYGIAID
jgi:hypothetical protein